MNGAIFRDFAAVAADAGDSLSRSAQAHLYDRLDWYRDLERHSGLGAPIVVKAQAGTASAWLFLRRDGRTLHSYANYYTLEFRPSTNKDALLSVISQLVSTLRSITNWDRLILSPIPDEDGTAGALHAAMPGSHLSQAATNWFAHTADTDAYWAARPSRLRNTIRRRRASTQLDISIFNVFEDIPFTDYESIYRRSWKPAEGSEAFVRALAKREGAAGTLRLGIARLAGEAIAAQLWLVENGRATIHKLAHDEAHKALSPGTLLTAAMFDHVLTADRPAEIDYGLGNEAYKADWMDAQRPRFRIDWFNPWTSRGRALHLAWRLRQRLAGLRTPD